MKILKNRAYPQLDNAQPVEQSGFRKGFATMDRIHTLNQLLEKANAYQLEINLMFVDFCKVFDSVYHGYL